MVIARNPEKVRDIIARARQKQKTVGFVPTMGALHQGHLSLVRKAEKECVFTAVSIFVNPAQFGPEEDFSRYPRSFRQDRILLEKEKVDLVFCPQPRIMYPEHFSTYVQESALSDNLCGRSRPGHFRGVCTVVAKLFNIVQPDKAYFGQKDLQQAIIIGRMVRDLDIPVKIRICPIIREKNGLAMSSRNRYLSSEEKVQAAAIYEALFCARSRFKSGETSALKLKNMIKNNIKAKAKKAKIDYISIVDYETLQDVKKIERKAAILAAVYIGKTRLIDNVIIRV